MFDKLGVKILGLVDNMSYFTGDDGKKYKIFGEGGVKKTADEFKKEFLGEIFAWPQRRSAFPTRQATARHPPNSRYNN